MPLEAQWETLFGDTFTATPQLHNYEIGATVYRKIDFAGALSSWTPQSYTIISQTFYVFDDAGTKRFADATKTAEATNAGAQPTDTTTGFFYTIQNDATAAKIFDVHESDLLTKAAAETYAGTQLGTFI